MSTAMNDTYINALLADASYVDGLEDADANQKLALRLTKPLAARVGRMSAALSAE